MSDTATVPGIFCNWITAPEYVSWTHRNIVSSDEVTTRAGCLFNRLVVVFNHIHARHGPLAPVTRGQKMTDMRKQPTTKLTADDKLFARASKHAIASGRCTVDLCLFAEGFVERGTPRGNAWLGWQPTRQSDQLTSGSQRVHADRKHRLNVEHGVVIKPNTRGENTSTILLFRR